MQQNGYNNIKRTYKQAFPRVKNLGNSSPDLVIEKEGQVYIIEIKLIPDKHRNAIRFERSFIDIVYLSNEIRQNSIRGFFVIVDKENTAYFVKNKFLDTCESHLNVKFEIHNNWELFSTDADSRVFIAEIKNF